MKTTGLPSTKKNILQFFLKKGEGTAAQLAKALDLSSQAIRRHLSELEIEGLIKYESVQQGMGRPQHIYQLSQQGKSLFPHRYGDFAVSFINTLVETVGPDGVSKVLEKQWQKKAQEYRDRVGEGSLLERVVKLAEIRQEEGYMAELHQKGQQNFIFTEYNCAISEVAESYPSVCGHELEMFSAILPDCRVERTHWLNNGEHRCGYLIQAK